MFGEYCLPTSGGAGKRKVIVEKFASGRAGSSTDILPKPAVDVVMASSEVFTEQEQSPPPPGQELQRPLHPQAVLPKSSPSFVCEIRSGALLSSDEQQEAGGLVQQQDFGGVSFSFSWVQQAEFLASVDFSASFNPADSVFRAKLTAQPQFAQKHSPIWGSTV